MKQYAKIYLLAALIILIALASLIVPSDGTGAIPVAILFLLALIIEEAGIAGQFGSPKTKAWVERKF